MRYYSSTAGLMTLAGGITSVATSLQVNSVTGLPASYPYTLILDPGISSEEIVQVTAAAGTTLTVTRGFDGTTAQAHSLGAQVIHGFTAQDAREAQEHAAASTNVHGLAGGSAVVGTTTNQTLTNKTLTSPFMSNANLSGTTVTQDLVSGGNITGVNTLGQTAGGHRRRHVAQFTPGNTDASGYVTITHGAGFTPAMVIVTPRAATTLGYLIGADNYTSTTVRLRFGNWSAGGLLVSGATGTLHVECVE